MELIGTIVKAVAWPVVAMLALVLLREPLGDLLERLSEFTGWGIHGVFKSRVKKAARKAARQARATVTLMAMPARVPAEEGRLLQLVAESPRSAVVEAWRLVESSVERAHAARGVSANSSLPPSPAEPTRTVQPQGVLDKATLSMVDNLYSLRNQAVHADDSSVDAASAREYVQLAVALAQRIEGEIH